VSDLAEQTPSLTGVPRVRPEGLAEAREAVLDGAADATPLLVTGGGTKLDWGSPPSRVGLVVDTGALDGIVAHDPGDMTATVRAGTSVAALNAVLRESGQWLAVDAPRTGADDPGATVGGVFAAGDSGPRRLRYGPVRDLVIGLTVVLSDGTIARSGGTVIKNVAGYDLGKVLCGSLGTLGLVTELTVRLHPLPEHHATVHVTATPGPATALVLDLAASPVVPSAVDATDTGLWVRIEGHGRGVEHQVASVRALAEVHHLESRVVEGAAEDDAWRGLVGDLAGRPDESVLATATVPSLLPDVAAAVALAARETGVGARLHSHAAVGLHRVALASPGGADAAAHAAAAELLRRRLRPLGAMAVLRHRPAGLDGQIDAWGALPPAQAGALPLMRRLKAQFDPAGRFAPGRFLGGI